MTNQPAKYFLALAAIAILPVLILVIAQIVRYFRIPEDFLVTATFFAFFAVLLPINSYSYRRQVKLGKTLNKSDIRWHFWLSLIAMILIAFAAHIVAPVVKSRGFMITLSFISIGFLLFIAGQIVFIVNWRKSKIRQASH